MPHVVRPVIPNEDKPCVRLKLLGHCDDGQCPYQHEQVTPVEKYALHITCIILCIKFLLPQPKA